MDIHNQLAERSTSETVRVEVTRERYEQLKKNLASGCSPDEIREFQLLDKIFGPKTAKETT